MKKLLLMTLFVFSLTAYAFAAGEGAHEKSMGGMMEQASSAVEVGNKICPVSGEEVDEMGEPVQYEYKGKIYNFCCTGCIEEFKKDPEKYVKIVQEQLAQEEKMGMGEIEEPEHMMVEEGEEGYHHMMGEMDEDDMMMDMEEEQPMMMNDEAPVKEINLEAFQFGFSPDPVVVKKGDHVKIHATSRDVPHGVFIKEYGINKTVEKGKTTDIEFIADKAGEFDIICSVYCGRGHANMRAKLIVKE